MERHDVSTLWAATHGDPGREATWTYLSYGPFDHEDAFTDWFAQRRASSDPLWFVVLGADAGPIGMATLMRLTPAHGVVELGNLWFVPDARRHTETTEAITLLLRHAAELGYRRLEWKCDAANLPSRRAALRLGFRFEGIFLNHMVIKGRNRDTAWYSITGDEWPAVDAALDRWLHPSNFDIEGNQGSSLREATAALW